VRGGLAPLVSCLLPAVTSGIARAGGSVLWEGVWEDHEPRLRDDLHRGCCAVGVTVAFLVVIALPS
jgi:hypothetical protein